MNNQNATTSICTFQAKQNAERKAKSEKELADYYTAQIIAHANGQPSTLGYFILEDE